VLENDEIENEDLNGNYDDKNKMEIFKLLDNAIIITY
jgi:hypothetical protein